LQTTPAEQLFWPPPVQDTRHFAAVHVTLREHESLPEQRTVLEAASAVTPPRQDRSPLQTMVQSSPSQLTAKAQSSLPPQVIWVDLAVLRTPPLQDPVPWQLTEQLLPLHAIPVMHAEPAMLGGAVPQEMSHLVARVQSMPWPQEVAPKQRTWQGWSAGHVTTLLQAPDVLQLKTQVPSLNWPPLAVQFACRTSGDGGL